MHAEENVTDVAKRSLTQLLLKLPRSVPEEGISEIYPPRVELQKAHAGPAGSRAPSPHGGMKGVSAFIRLSAHL